MRILLCIVIVDNNYVDNNMLAVIPAEASISRFSGGGVQTKIKIYLHFMDCRLLLQERDVLEHGLGRM